MPNEIKIELFRIHPFFKDQHRPIFLDKRTLLIIGIFDLSLIEWPHSDNHLDLIVGVVLKYVSHLRNVDIGVVQVQSDRGGRSLAAGLLRCLGLARSLDCGEA